MLDAAESHMQAGRVAEAIDTFRALLSADPDNGALRGRVAEAYRRAGNVERAFHHFNKAATLFIRRSDLPEAIRMLEAANRISPNEPDILFRWAECLEQTGTIEGLHPILLQLIGVATAPGDRRRLWALDRLVQLEPDNFDLAISRAAVLCEVGRIDEGVPAWRHVSATLGRSRQDWAAMIARSAERCRARPDYATQLAHILLANRRPREALALLVPFYEEFPDDPDILETVIQALEGVDAREKILPARVDLLRAQIRRRLRGPALEGVAQLLRQHPTDPDVLTVCAEACRQFGLDSEGSRLRFQLCQLHDRRGDAEARDEVLTALLRDDPTHESALTMAIDVLKVAGRTEEARALMLQLGRVRGEVTPYSEPSPTPPWPQAPTAQLGVTAPHPDPTSSNGFASPLQVTPAQPGMTAPAPTPASTGGTLGRTASASTGGTLGRATPASTGGRTLGRAAPASTGGTLGRAAPASTGGRTLGRAAPASTGGGTLGRAAPASTGGRTPPATPTSGNRPISGLEGADASRRPCPARRRASTPAALGGNASPMGLPTSGRRPASSVRSAEVIAFGEPAAGPLSIGAITTPSPSGMPTASRPALDERPQLVTGALDSDSAETLMPSPRGPARNTASDMTASDTGPTRSPSAASADARAQQPREEPRGLSWPGASRDPMFEPAPRWPTRGSSAVWADGTSPDRLAVLDQADVSWNESSAVLLSDEDVLSTELEQDELWVPAAAVTRTLHHRRPSNKSAPRAEAPASPPAETPSPEADVSHPFAPPGSSPFDAYDANFDGHPTLAVPRLNGQSVAGLDAEDELALSEETAQDLADDIADEFVDELPTRIDLRLFSAKRRASGAKPDRATKGRSRRASRTR